jgi:hypothetical protein
MSEFVTVIAVVALVAYVIGRQIMGEPLRGKRVVLLPAILTVIGLSDLGGHLRPIDVACLIAGALVVAGIGVAQGSVIRLESRDGALWGQMPVKGLWLWALLVASRILMTVVALGLGAHVAASSSAILLMLGINRLAQSAVVLPRALSAGVPFAPEKNGTTFLAGLTAGVLDRVQTTPSAPRATGTFSAGSFSTGSFSTGTFSTATFVSSGTSVSTAGVSGTAVTNADRAPRTGTPVVLTKARPTSSVEVGRHAQCRRAQRRSARGFTMPRQS